MSLSPKCDRCGSPVSECLPECTIGDLTEKFEATEKKLKNSEHYRTNGPMADLYDECLRFQDAVFVVPREPDYTHVYLRPQRWEALLAAIDKVRKNPLV